MIDYRHLAHDSLADLLDMSRETMMDIILDAGHEFLQAKLGDPESRYYQAVKTSPEFWKWWMQVSNNRCDMLIQEIQVKNGWCWFNGRIITSPVDWLTHMFRPSFIPYYPNNTVINAALDRIKTQAA